MLPFGALLAACAGGAWTRVATRRETSSPVAVRLTGTRIRPDIGRFGGAAPCSRLGDRAAAAPGCDYYCVGDVAEGGATTVAPPSVPPLTHGPPPADAPVSVPLPPADRTSPPTTRLSEMLAELTSTDAQLTVLTGGVGAADMLAEFARTAARELAQHFDRLPNRLFEGTVRRATGWRGWLGRVRRVRHRVLAVRYTSIDPMLTVGPSMMQYDATGYVLAIGEDGVLRTATVDEAICLDTSATIPDEAIAFADDRVRNIPTSRAAMHPWGGGNDPSDVAPPEIVLDLLRQSAAILQQQQHLQGALLRRLLAE